MNSLRAYVPVVDEKAEEEDENGLQATTDKGMQPMNIWIKSHRITKKTLDV